MLANILSRYWWATLLRGALWILFGGLVLAQPGLSLVALAITFGTLTLADGIVSVVTAVGGRKTYENWWLLLLTGITGIVVGLLSLASPGLTALGLLLYIAVWSVATGLLTVAAAIHLRREIEGEGWLALAGVASVLFGILVAVRPGAGALAVLTLIGTYAIVMGVALIALALRARAFVGRVKTAARDVVSAGAR
ncbi:hypothetical protein TBR22_A03740 [Luteitalea sp. TBR-22]|uniref:HdeD family acid-resistance protein n=1 Tax=Luteitalea sp. TBR-22 TaxID=2802971 RepID=UPI001AF2044B|nr:HdeD family acid-resistance protein [Luteitalea sp. TBR-22]BCS31174.1 hypothetical protein TBR22_A03740 [Luteitalea sp. TBR-22]